MQQQQQQQPLSVMLRGFCFLGLMAASGLSQPTSAPKPEHRQPTTDKRPTPTTDKRKRLEPTDNPQAANTHNRQAQAA